MNLEEFFSKYREVAIGFSGGVDSSYLLYAAKKCGAKVRAYFIKTPFQPKFELEDAKCLAEKLNADLSIIEYDLSDEKHVLANKADRCYHCKKALFGILKERAARDGFKVIIDGSNASDIEEDRPGMKALSELGVLSPLRMCKISKGETRRLSKEAGLFTWNKPAYACLATRIPAGTKITFDMLKRIERAEDLLFSLGFSDFRARIIEGALRLQLPLEQFQAVLDKRDIIIDKLKEDFKDILLDLIPRINE